jgi:phosphoribosylformylglycinamidine synthase PurS subunit
MARVVVDVMLKPEILDPQGQAVQRALPRLGFAGVADVRQGKRFEIELDGPADEAALARVREMAEKLLANTVIEEYRVRVAEDGASAADAEAVAAGAQAGV